MTTRATVVLQTGNLKSMNWFFSAPYGIRRSAGGGGRDKISSGISLIEYSVWHRRGPRFETRKVGHLGVRHGGLLEDLTAFTWRTFPIGPNVVRRDRPPTSQD